MDLGLVGRAAATELRGRCLIAGLLRTAVGKAANAMTEDEWEEFYDALSKHLRRNYPDLYARLFWPNKIGQGKKGD
jgi:hypothetical protein